MRLTNLTKVCAFCVFLALSPFSLASDITVAAAASLTDAFTEMAHRFSQQNPEINVQLTFGASGALLQQITHGAPVDVFTSADQKTMDMAVERSLMAASSRHDFAQNTLVLITPSIEPAALNSLHDLTQDSIQRIAVGIPASVPVGRYTQAALEAENLWQALTPKIINAQNVRQVLDYVARGEVNAGFVYATDAAIMADKVTVLMTVPLAQDIRYPIAALKNSNNPIAAQKFIQFVLSTAGQTILANYGFSQP